MLLQVLVNQQYFATILTPKAHHQNKKIKNLIVIFVEEGSYHAKTKRSLRRG